MFEIGFSELALIAVVALLVLGPERLPTAARTVGSLMRRARSSWSSLRDEIERELAVREHVESIKRAAEPARESIDQLKHELASAGDEVDKAKRAVEGEPGAAPRTHE